MKQLKLTVSIDGDRWQEIDLRPVVRRQLFALAAFDDLDLARFIARCLTLATNEHGRLPGEAVVPEKEMDQFVPDEWYETWGAMRTEADYQLFMHELANGEEV